MTARESKGLRDHDRTWGRLASTLAAANLAAIRLGYEQGYRDGKAGVPSAPPPEDLIRATLRRRPL